MKRKIDFSEGEHVNVYDDEGHCILTLEGAGGGFIDIVPPDGNGDVDVQSERVPDLEEDRHDLVEKLIQDRIRKYTPVYHDSAFASEDPDAPDSVWPNSFTKPSSRVCLSTDALSMFRFTLELAGGVTKEESASAMYQTRYLDAMELALTEAERMHDEIGPGLQPVSKATSDDINKLGLYRAMYNSVKSGCPIALHCITVHLTLYYRRALGKGTNPDERDKLFVPITRQPTDAAGIICSVADEACRIATKTMKDRGVECTQHGLPVDVKLFVWRSVGALFGPAWTYLATALCHKFDPNNEHPSVSVMEDEFGIRSNWDYVWFGLMNSMDQKYVCTCCNAVYGSPVMTFFSEPDKRWQWTPIVVGFGRDICQGDATGTNDRLVDLRKYYSQTTTKVAYKHRTVQAKRTAAAVAVANAKKAEKAIPSVPRMMCRAAVHIASRKTTVRSEGGDGSKRDVFTRPYCSTPKSADDLMAWLDIGHTTGDSYNCQVWSKAQDDPNPSNMHLQSIVGDAMTDAIFKVAERST